MNYFINKFLLFILSIFLSSFIGKKINSKFEISYKYFSDFKMLNSSIELKIPMLYDVESKTYNYGEISGVGKKSKGKYIRLKPNDINLPEIEIWLSGLCYLDIVNEWNDFELLNLNEDYYFNENKLIYSKCLNKDKSISIIGIYKKPINPNNIDNYMDFKIICRSLKIIKVFETNDIDTDVFK
jgi:hypothetical protein